MKKYIFLFALLLLVSGAMFGQEPFRLTVIADYYPDPYDPQSPYVRVHWSGTGSYKVYRSNCYDTNPELLAENVTGGQYIDTDWTTVEPGEYMYGVKSATGSQIFWSNCLDNRVYAEMVSIMVQAGDGNSPEGTTVSFLNHNSIDQALYPISPITIDETGVYMWDIFRKGNYQITITKPEYETIVDEVAIWEDYYSMSYTLMPSNAYTITVSANPTSGGSPYIGNTPGTTQATFTSGQSCTVHANPANGYNFIKWTENGAQVSANANYTFTVTSNRNLVAHYQTGPTEYTIITDVIPTGSGIVTGGGTYSSGVQATLTAIANEGYTFEDWQDGNTDNPRSITVTDNATYTAYFTQLPQYTITATADPDEGGIVEGGGQYYLGATCSLHASANEGYYFVNWTKDGSDFSDLPDTSFVVTENAIYEAHFFQGSGGYTISVRANPEEGGNVTGSGTYVQDIPITLIATPNEGYEFTNWTENGVIQCLTNQYEFVVDRNRVLVANFEQLPVFTISASAGENGSIDPQGDIQVVKGSDITFTIRPDFGFRITSVMVDGNNTGQADTYTFTNIDCNHTIHVSFNGWGIEDYNAAEVKVYPNPANDKVHVEGEGIESVALFDLLGNCLRNMDFSTSNTLNVSGLSKGIYVLMLTTQDGRIGYQKLIIAK
jgi:hypothetical protein